MTITLSLQHYTCIIHAVQPIISSLADLSCRVTSHQPSVWNCLGLVKLLFPAPETAQTFTPQGGNRYIHQHHLHMIQWPGSSTDGWVASGSHGIYYVTSTYTQYESDDHQWTVSQYFYRLNESLVSGWTVRIYLSSVVTVTGKALSPYNNVSHNGIVRIDMWWLQPMDNSWMCRGSNSCNLWRRWRAGQYYWTITES